MSISTFIMNICLVSQEYPEETDFGGIATYMRYLSKGLSKNNIVYVIARSYIENQRYSDNNVKIIRICETNEWEYRVKVAEVLSEIVESVHIDIIETPEWGADMIAFYERYRSRYKVPIVVKLHTPYFIWRKYNNASSNSLIENWEKRIICEADGVFSCSKALKHIVAERYGLDSCDIPVIHNMIDFEDNTQSAEISTSISDDIICYIGSLEERKGVFVLAEAFKKAKEKNSNLKLIYIGRDTIRNGSVSSSKQIIENIIGNDKDVIFINHVNNELLGEYIEKSKVMVFPSLFENFPYVVLEAMKYGKAVIGSYCGGMVEMMENNTSGLFYTPPDSDELADVITSLIVDDSKILELGRNARLKVREFSTKNIIPKQLKYYKEVIKIYERQLQ